MVSRRSLITWGQSGGTPQPSPSPSTLCPIPALSTARHQPVVLFHGAEKVLGCRKGVCPAETGEKQGRQEEGQEGTMW